MDPGSLFSLSEHLERLSKHGDPLEVLDATIDFEYFRGGLLKGLDMVTVPRVVGPLLILYRCSRF